MLEVFSRISQQILIKFGTDVKHSKEENMSLFFLYDAVAGYRCFE